MTFASSPRKAQRKDSSPISALTESNLVKRDSLLMLDEESKESLKEL